MPEVTEMLQTSDLQEYIRARGLAAEVVRPERPTPTVAAAAAAMGVGPERIIKSLLFMADGRPVLVIASGRGRVNRQRLARHLDLPRKHVRIASRQEVESITGYGVGGVPPFGHRAPIRTLLDDAVLEQAWVYGGGGASDVLLRVQPEEIAVDAQAEAVDVTDPDA